MKVLSRRSGQEPFGFGVVAVEHRHPGAERRLAAGKLHVWIFRQNLAERSSVAGPVQHGCGAPEPDDWRLFAGGKHVLINVDRFRKAALENIGVGQKIVSIRISRIEREGGGEVALGFVKMVASAIDVAGENKKRRAVRQTRPRDCEFFHCALVIAQTPEEIIGLGEMRFS